MSLIKNSKLSAVQALLIIFLAVGLVSAWRSRVGAMPPPASLICSIVPQACKTSSSPPPPATTPYLTDTLPTGFDYKSGSASIAPNSESGNELKWKINDALAGSDSFVITLSATINQDACDPTLDHNNSVVADKLDGTGQTSAVKSTPSVTVKCGGLTLTGGDVATAKNITKTSLLTIKSPAVVIVGGTVDNSVYDRADSNIKIITGQDISGNINPIATSFINSFKRIIKEGLYSAYNEYSITGSNLSILNLNPDNRAGGGIYYYASGSSPVKLNYRNYSGKGTLVVEGNVEIDGDIILDKSKNEFLGVVALKLPDGTGGNIYFAPDPTYSSDKLRLENVAFFAEGDVDLSGKGNNDCTDYVVCRDIDMDGSIFAKGKVILGDSGSKYRRQGNITYAPNILNDTPPGFARLVKSIYSEVAP